MSEESYKDIAVIKISRGIYTRNFYIFFIDNTTREILVLELDEFRERYTKKPIIKYLLLNLKLNLKMIVRRLLSGISSIFRFKHLKP